MSKTFCKKCRHFIRHYIQTEKGYDMIDCGHCVFEDLSLKIDSCPKFQPMQRDEIAEKLKNIEEKVEMLCEKLKN